MLFVVYNILKSAVETFRRQWVPEINFKSQKSGNLKVYKYYCVNFIKKLELVKVSKDYT